MNDPMAFMMGAAEEDTERLRPEVRAGYPGECGVCFSPFKADDPIRALPGGDGWEAVEHGHEYDPESLLPIPTKDVETGRTPLPAPPEGLYTPPPSDAQLYAAMGSGHPEVEQQASDLLSMSPQERAAYLNPPSVDGEGLYADSPPDDRTVPVEFTCPVRECGKKYAPTKNRLVRTHKFDGAECAGSRQTPVELLTAADTEPSGEQAQAVAPTPPAVLLVPEPGSALANAVATSSQVAGIVERINTGRMGEVPPFVPFDGARDLLAGDDRAPAPPQDDGRTPEQQAEMDARRGAGGVLELARFVASPPEDAPTGAQEDCDQRMEAALPAPSTVHLITSAPPAPAAPIADPALTGDAAAAQFMAEQPDADRDRYGRYKMGSPGTGGVKARTRATTFASTVEDTFNLHQWEKRHVVRGLTDRPDLLVKARGLDVSKDKDSLNAIAEEAALASGSKTAAEQGTLVHKLTEDIDRAAPGSVEQQRAREQVPEKYRKDVIAYLAALEEFGLRVVPGMLERSTLVPQYNVAGTLDQVLEFTRDVQLPGGRWARAGDRVVGDKKTGSSVELGALVHSIQLALYAHGLNECGVYDWTDKTWTAVPRVREDVGVIIHIPLERGVCTLYVLDLELGWNAAQLSQAVRNLRNVGKRKGVVSNPLGATVPWTRYKGEVIVQQQADGNIGGAEYWERAAMSVQSREQAAAMYDAMVAAGVPQDVMDRTVQRAMDRLSSQEQAAPLVPPTVAPLALPVPPAPLTPPVVHTVDQWMPRAVRIGSPAQAAQVYQEMADAAVPQDIVDAVVKQMQGKLTALDQAAGQAPAPAAAPVPPAPAAAPPAIPPEPTGVGWQARVAAATTNDLAYAVYQDAVDAGMGEPLLQQLTAAMKEAVARTAQQNPQPVPVAPAVDWEARARCVTTPQEAAALWDQAASSGDPAMSQDRLQALGRIMQAAVNEPPF